MMSNAYGEEVGKLPRQERMYVVLYLSGEADVAKPV